MRGRGSDVTRMSHFGPRQWRRCLGRAHAFPTRGRCRPEGATVNPHIDTLGLWRCVNEWQDVGEGRYSIIEVAPTDIDPTCNPTTHAPTGGVAHSRKRTGPPREEACHPRQVERTPPPPRHPLAQNELLRPTARDVPSSTPRVAEAWGPHDARIPPDFVPPGLSPRSCPSGCLCSPIVRRGVGTATIVCRPVLDPAH